VETLPFIALLIAAIVLITVFPGIVTTLPTLMVQ